MHAAASLDPRRLVSRRVRIAAGVAALALFGTTTASALTLAHHDRKPILGPREGIEMLDEKPETSNGLSNSQMQYHGGTVQSRPTVYLVYWGDWNINNDANNVHGRLYDFYRGIGASPWNATQTQYGSRCSDGTICKHVGNPSNLLADHWFDRTTVPTTPTQTDIANEALRAADHFGSHLTNDQFVIALQPGHGDVDFKNGKYCAWHSAVKQTSSSPWLTYTALPYMPDAGTGTCANNSVNNSILDGATIVASHEFAETETDPVLDAWYDKDGDETGDKCQGVNPANVTFSTGTFPVQTLWSNAARHAGRNGCVIS